MRAIVALARADLRERMRRSSFLVTLACVLWLGLGTFDGSVSVNLAGTQGVLNAAWVGGMMAMVAITFLSLAGFWVVKNAVDRDERTGVGAILATTPLRRVEYTLGKALSHLLVLGGMVAILGLCGIALLLLRSGGAGDSERFDVVALLAPFVVCAIPAFALTAALAILFETTPGLRGGAANALWLFLWIALLMASTNAKSPLGDPWGILILQRSMSAAAHDQLGVDPNSFSIQLNPGMASAPMRTFAWHGVQWTPAILASRLGWLLVAVAIAALAAVPFHRFDPSRMRLRLALRRREPAARAARPAGPSLLSRLPSGLVGSELRLLLGGANRWWTVVALGLVVATWVTPLAVARATLLPAAWLWPVLRWSDLGGRDARHGTEAFVLTAPHALTRQLPATWLAGLILALAMGAGVGLRLAFAGDGMGVLAWLAGALFIPSLALALGLLSRGNRLFEIVYVCLWYVGPVNRTPELDFMGATGAGHALPWLALTGALLTAATLIRARQLRG